MSSILHIAPKGSASSAAAFWRIMEWNLALISRASTSLGTPASIAAMVTESTFDEVSLPVVIRGAIVRADGIR